MLESEFLVAVLHLARLRGCLVHHCRPARTASGWSTPIQGDSGFPDLVIAGAGGVLFRELKTETGTVTVPQRLWIDRLSVAQVNVAVWRPDDLRSGLVDSEIREVSR